MPAMNQQWTRFIAQNFRFKFKKFLCSNLSLLLWKLRQNFKNGFGMEVGWVFEKIWIKIWRTSEPLVLIKKCTLIVVKIRAWSPAHFIARRAIEFHFPWICFISTGSKTVHAVLDVVDRWVGVCTIVLILKN